MVLAVGWGMTIAIVYQPAPASVSPDHEDPSRPFKGKSHWVTRDVVWEKLATALHPLLRVRVLAVPVEDPSRSPARLPDRDGQAHQYT